MSRRDPQTITVTSRLAAPPEAVWAHARTMAGVNAELKPLVRMTVPSGTAAAATLADAPLGRPAFTSLLLLGGLVPFDRHDLTLTRVSEGPSARGFSERSRSLLHIRWDHDRTIVDDNGGSLITDRVTFLPRFGGRLSTRLEKAIVGALFRHRHRRLLELLGPARR